MQEPTPSASWLGLARGAAPSSLTANTCRSPGRPPPHQRPTPPQPPRAAAGLCRASGSTSPTRLDHVGDLQRGGRGRAPQRQFLDAKPVPAHGAAAGGGVPGLRPAGRLLPGPGADRRQLRPAHGGLGAEVAPPGGCEPPVRLGAPGLAGLPGLHGAAEPAAPGHAAGTGGGGAGPRAGLAAGQLPPQAAGQVPRGPRAGERLPARPETLGPPPAQGGEGQSLVPPGLPQGARGRGAGAAGPGGPPAGPRPPAGPAGGAPPSLPGDAQGAAALRAGAGGADPRQPALRGGDGVGLRAGPGVRAETHRVPQGGLGGSAAPAGPHRPPRGAGCTDPAPPGHRRHQRPPGPGLVAPPAWARHGHGMARVRGVEPGVGAAEPQGATPGEGGGEGDAAEHPPGPGQHGRGAGTGSGPAGSGHLRLRRAGAGRAELHCGGGADQAGGAGPPGLVQGGDGQRARGAVPCQLRPAGALTSAPLSVEGCTPPPTVSCGRDGKGGPCPDAPKPCPADPCNSQPPLSPSGPNPQAHLPGGWGLLGERSQGSPDPTHPPGPLQPLMSATPTTPSTIPPQVPRVWDTPGSYRNNNKILKPPRRRV